MKIKIIQVWDQKKGVWKNEILQDEEIDDFKKTSIPVERNACFSDYKNSIKNIETTKIMYSSGYELHKKETN